MMDFIYDTLDRLLNFKDWLLDFISDFRNYIIISLGVVAMFFIVSLVMKYSGDNNSTDDFQLSDNVALPEIAVSETKKDNTIGDIQPSGNDDLLRIDISQNKDNNSSEDPRLTGNDVLPKSGVSQSAETHEQISWRRSFDEQDRLTKLIDPADRETRLEYTYTPDKSLCVTKTPPEGNQVVWEYDEKGHLSKMTDGDGTVAYGYDDLGRINHIQREKGPAFSYGYDMQDRIVSMCMGDFYKLDYTYDFLGRLASINTPVGAISYEYLTGQGLLVRTLPNGVQTIWESEVNGQLRKITHGKPIGKNEVRILAEYTYEYQSDGLISTIGERSTRGEFTTFYKYDKVGRLIEATETTGKRYHYEYDLVGNRLRATKSNSSPQVCTNDWASRLTSFNEYTCTHDASGNLSSYYKSPDTKYTIKYNCLNLLKEANTVDYRYDGFGYLTTRSNNDLETNYISDPLSKEWKPIRAREGKDKKTFYIWEGQNPLVTIQNGELNFFLHDHLGSVRLVVDEDAKIVNQLDYSPFGISMNQLDAGSLQFGFTGLVFDSKSQLYLTRARGYNPIIGRFLQIDPQHRFSFGSQKDFSSYAYCGNDPINYVDRTGFVPVPAGMGPGFMPPGGFVPLGPGGSVPLGPGGSVPLGPGGSVPLGPGGSIPLGPGGSIPLGPGGSVPFGPGGQALFNKGGAKNSPKGGKKGIFGGPFGDGARGPLGQWIDGLGGLLPGRDPTPPPDLAPKPPRPRDLPGQSDTLPPPTAGGPKGGGKGGRKGGLGPFRPPPRPSPGGPGPRTNPGRMSKMAPSPVGGVYLGGSGKMLDGMGLLEGVSLDSNNNLILLSKSGDEINLPQLRLDDVVTVFRSVYVHGEGPTVTIDPNPKNPEGPTMIIKHGKATENTYVGWVLYHADRIMKGYTLGKDTLGEDSKTGEDLISTVPGYEEVLNTLYFGDSTPEKNRKGGKWERFWIVPSYARHYNDDHNELTLFDVPLKVKTQVMKWESGKLVDDPKGKSSAGATDFIEWFTRQYKPISREQYLTPPTNSGITKPVPVFSELRRIALMTAIAEKLQDQGIPMPFWMRNYEVSPVTVDENTPALRIERSNGVFTAHVYGGANMSPESKDVKQITTQLDLEQLPEPERKLAKKNLDRANMLSKVVRKSVLLTEPFKLQKISIDNDTYHTLPIPGSDTRALASCRLEESDILLPIEGGYEISFSRKYNSFFEPSGPWGKGWTMDLPRLNKIQKAIERKDNIVTFRTEYELITPLNSLYTRFPKVREVPALNNSQLQTPDKECDFFGLAGETTSFTTVPTRKLLRKDGGIWHFTKGGDLAAIEEDGFRTVFYRDQVGRVFKIVGLLGLQEMATIVLKYDIQGKLESATGKNNNGEQRIRYEYDSFGKLSYVVSDQGKLGYRYTGPWITSITWQDSGVINDENQKQEKTLRSFKYNARGQLTSETREDGQRITYNITSSPQGITVTTTYSGEKDPTRTIRYDTTYRPIDARYENGTQATWIYSDNGENVLNLKYSDGENIKITESSDKRRQTFDAPDMPQLTKEYDEAGRLINISVNNKNILRQHWYPGGQLQAVENDSCAFSPQYNQDGLMTSVILTPPEEKENRYPQHWQNTKIDFARKPIEITDYRGLHILINYDNKGNIKQVVTKHDKNNYNFNITRDNLGRIQTVDSSWDKRQFIYDENGAVEKVTINRPGRKGPEQSVLKFKSGQLISAKQFDGGKLVVSYYGEGPQENLLEQVTCANGLNLVYHYDSSNNLEKVKIGKQSQIALVYDTKGRIISYSCSPQRNKN